LLKIDGLSVAIDSQQILHNVNLHIKPGELHVLLGPNGSGKSTLIGSIMGFTRYMVTAGRIYFKEQDITDLPIDERARLGIGIMLQRPPTVRGLSIRQMVSICGKHQVDVEKLAARVNMQELLDRGVNEGLSGGEIKRSELLQLMAQQPELVMMDEPESGVDLDNIALVGEAVNYILQSGGTKADGNRQKAGLIITHTGHILNYVQADTAHIIYQGTITCHGKPRTLLDCVREQGYERCAHCLVKGEQQ